MADRTAERVRTIIARAIKAKPSEILPDSNLGDLGADALELMIVALDVEMAFELPIGGIDDVTRAGWMTVGDIVATVEQLTSRAAA